MMKQVIQLCIIAFATVFAHSDESNSTILSQLNDGFKLTDITAHDGVTLKSIFFDPKPTQENGKNPLIVFISSWGMNKWEYVVPANEYSKKGYTVVSYTARGFWESGGVIDMAGSNDMADVSTAIDWAIANTNADPARIGLSGISYGGGISILASAKDGRVKSVAAMSCWVDMAESFLGNGETIRTEAAKMLEALAEITGKPSEDLETLFDDYFNNKNLDFLYDFTYNSSAVNFIDDINKNKPAMFIANALSDSLFTPNQFPDFYNQLEMPKHLEFAPGDHAGPELPGLLGLPDQVWERAGEWNDFYLLNNQVGIDPDMPSIVFNAMNGDEIESYDSWDEVTTSYVKYQLNPKEKMTTIKSKVEEIDLTSVLAEIATGANANINGGVAYISATIRAYVDVQRRFSMPLIKRKYGAVFISDHFDYAYRYRGVPKLSLNIIPASSNGTLVMYLLDVDDLGVGHLFTFAPWTFKDATPNHLLTLEMDLPVSSYDISQGRRLGLVIATHDMLYLDQNPADSSIQFVDGSVLSMPIH